MQGSLFNRYDGKAFFPRSRPINFVHVGATTGSIIDRYGALGRGSRLDDVLVLIEPNPVNAKRLGQRIRMDQRLLLSEAAAWDVDGTAWFQFEAVPNAVNKGGKLLRSMPENVTAAMDAGLGMAVRTVTLDTLLRKVTGPIDFLMMDADAHEPWILKGAKETLARTRLMIFACNDKWAEAGAGLDALAAVKEVFEPAGLEVSLLGEKRNLLLKSGMLPEGFTAADLPSWGFCMAAQMKPPLIRKVSEIARFVAGPDAVEGPCGKYIAALPSAHCKDGLLSTLDGVDRPVPSPEYSRPFY
jgi:FkbM family methyltransferase